MNFKFLLLILFVYSIYGYVKAMEQDVQGKLYQYEDSSGEEESLIDQDEESITVYKVYSLKELLFLY